MSVTEVQGFDLRLNEFKLRLLFRFSVSRLQWRIDPCYVSSFSPCVSNCSVRFPSFTSTKRSFFLLMCVSGLTSESTKGLWCSQPSLMSPAGPCLRGIRCKHRRFSDVLCLWDSETLVCHSSGTLKCDVICLVVTRVYCVVLCYCCVVIKS